MSSLLDNYPLSEFATLPHGWHWANLDEVVIPHDGHWGQESPFPGASEVIVLGVGNVSNDGRLRFEGAPKRFLEESDLEAVLNAGDLTVVKSSGSSTNIRSGKTAICPVELSGTVACSNFMIRLEPKKDKVDSMLLWYLLNSDYAKSFVRIIAGSTTYPNIKWQTLKDFTFPLPPLDEQCRIVFRLNEQMTEIEKARIATAAQQQAISRLITAELSRYFSNPLKYICKDVSVSEIAASIDYGFTASAKSSKDGPRFLRITDIQNGIVDWSAVPGCEIAKELSGKYYLLEGDIVFARTGATTGKSFLITNPPDAIFASYLIRLRPNSCVMPTYLFAYFQSESYWRQIRASARGGAQPNVNAGLLGKLRVPLAPLDHQQHIVNQFVKVQEEARKLSELMKRQEAQLTALSKAVISRAFDTVS